MYENGAMRSVKAVLRKGKGGTKQKDEDDESNIY
jgi:hypothetical protein